MDEDILIDEDDFDPKADQILNQAQQTIESHLPQPQWEWNLFGVDPGLVMVFTVKISLWQRFWTKIFFKSTWKRM